MGIECQGIRTERLRKVVMPILLCGLLVLTLNNSAVKQWESDLSRAKARALKENKPIFVVFRCEH